jgi:hypothetical protein
MPQNHQINLQLLQGIVWCELNNCMDDLTRTQQQQTKPNDVQTTTWLKQNGITEKQFQDLPVIVLQAQRVAAALLQNHQNKITKAKLRQLKTYTQTMRNSKKRKKLTTTQARTILNIGTQANRKLFKQLRQQHQANNSR